MPRGIHGSHRGRPATPIADRLWPRTDRSTDCWLWTGYKGRTGYGMIGIGGHQKVDRVHRVAWLLVNGPIPDGLAVLHRCDNRACVRPEHLFLGTQEDNIADMDAKGRRRVLRGDAHPAKRPGARAGIRNGRHRLTPDDVRAIRSRRAEGAMYNVIAAEFGVATPTIQHVVSGKNWAHIE